MTAVIFATPGLIDIQSFTTFGINVKPNTTNPIGYFGTGLKYAIAVLCRIGASPVLWIGPDKYTFYVKPTKFRDKEFDLIRMKLEKLTLLRPRHIKLPFTTELGKNWKVWQAFRELESNTRDEGGLTYLGVDRDDAAYHQPGSTTLIVENDEFVQAYHDRDTIFLPEALNVREGTERLQVIDKPAKTIFYRGLKVAETRKPTLFTYNFLKSVELTEDRTIKYDFSVRAELARHIVTSNDEKLIERIVTAPDSVWESGLEFDYQNEPPSDAFRKVIDRRKNVVSRSALRYMAPWASAPAHMPRGTFDKYPRPWKRSGTHIYDDNGNHVMSCHYDDQMAIDVVDIVNKAGEAEPPTEATEDADRTIPF